MTKKKYYLQLKEKLFFLLSKTTIYLSLGLHKGPPRYKRSLQLSKEHPALQNMKFLIFFSTFVGHFCPPGSRSELRIPIRIRTPNTDPDPIRIGSATLLFSCARNYSSPCAPHWSGGGPVYAPILPSRAYDHTPAPSPPPHLARKPATDHVATGTVLILVVFSKTTNFYYQPVGFWPLCARALRAPIF